MTQNPVLPFYALTMIDYQAADEITLVHSGADFFGRLIRLLDEARETIYLQTYIFEADATGAEVADALRRAALRGVRVRVLADGFGAKDLPPDLIANLRAAGVEFRFFELAVSIWKWRGGRTLHHKVVVADGRQAMIGGINISDRYRGTDTELPWFDFAVFIRGTVCAELAGLCDSIFLHRYWKRQSRTRSLQNQAAVANTAGLVRFRQNDWLRRKTEVFQSYQQGISGAREELVLVASYFLPGSNLRGRLIAAARRGVVVKILLSGPSDVALSRLAEQHLAYGLARQGVRVFLWEKSVMHGKAILADRRWASLGSYNMNRLSWLRSVEMNVDVRDSDFTTRFGDYLDDLLLHQCTELSVEDLRPPGWWQRCKVWGAYYLVYYLMWLLFPKRR